MKKSLLKVFCNMTKWTVYIMILQTISASLLLAEPVSAQVKSIYEVQMDLSVKSEKVFNVIRKLEDKSDFEFSYNSRSFKDHQIITLEVKDSNLGAILEKISSLTNLGFRRVNNNIHIYPRAKTDIPVEEVNETPIRTVNGRVTDADGEPLPGATILEKDTKKGTITDVDGNFSIDVADDAILTITFVGYQAAEIPVNGRSSINVSLELDQTSLSEVLVIGYGTVNKSDLTGSVASVGPQDISAYPSNNAIQAIQGRASGVQVTQTNGEPGSGYKVSIRGNTSINASSDPLYVVDGLVGGVLPPPEDIQSIEILKDASATAIYGSRGANGVVMITTKRGKSGPVKVDFSSSWSLQQAINEIEVLNGSEYANFINDVEPGFYSDPSSFGVGTDWQDEIFRNGGLQNYQLSVSGGSDNVQYYLSGVYYDQKGIIENSDFNRYSITSNINIDATDWLSFGGNLFGRGSRLNGTNSQKAPGSSQADVIEGAYTFPSTLEIFDSEGNYIPSDRGFQIDNPVAVANELQIDNLSDLLQVNTYGEVNLFKSLKFRSSVGAKVLSSRYGRYYPTTLLRGAPIDGEGEMRTSKRRELLTENYFTFSPDLGNAHALSVVAGSSFQSFSTENLRVITNGFPSDANLWWDLNSASSTANVSSGLTESELLSYYGRVNYTLMGKYLVTFTARQDGSSVLAEGNKWKFFPSAALAWNLSRENFMSGLSQINQFKVRGSYGLTGNQAIQPYESLGQLTSVFTTQNGNVVTALRPSNLGNAELTWETTAQTDIGIDLGILDDQFTITLDYYKMITSDLLFDVELPGFIGVATQTRNIGEVENKGFEVAVGAKLMTNNQLNWSVSANLSLNRNKILKLAENNTEGNDVLYGTVPLEGSSGLESQILREGESVGTFYGYVYDGVLQSGENALDLVHASDQNPGGRKFADLDGDGALTADDRTIIGNPHPDFIYGLNNNLSFKNFDLNIFILGKKGGDIMNYTAMDLGLLNGRSNQSKDVVNRWTPSNTNTDIPSANIDRVFIVSDRWVEDGSFLRLKNVSLGYTFKDINIEKFHLRSARIYISAQNLYTITKYSGVDPEIAYSSSNKNIGLDYASYPNVKSFTAGLNIGF